MGTAADNALGKLAFSSYCGPIPRALRSDAIGAGLRGAGGTWKTPTVSAISIFCAEEV
jgi:hypothetical protein